MNRVPSTPARNTRSSRLRPPSPEPVMPPVASTPGSRRRETKTTVMSTTPMTTTASSKNPMNRPVEPCLSGSNPRNVRRKEEKGVEERVKTVDSSSAAVDLNDAFIATPEKTPSELVKEAFNVCKLPIRDQFKIGHTVWMNAEKEVTNLSNQVTSLTREREDFQEEISQLRSKVELLNGNVEALSKDRDHWKSLYERQKMEKVVNVQHPGNLKGAIAQGQNYPRPRMTTLKSLPKTIYRKAYYGTVLLAMALSSLLRTSLTGISHVNTTLFSIPDIVEKRITSGGLEILGIKFSMFVKRLEAHTSLDQSKGIFYYETNTGIMSLKVTELTTCDCSCVLVKPETPEQAVIEAFLKSLCKKCSQDPASISLYLWALEAFKAQTNRPNNEGKGELCQDQRKELRRGFLENFEEGNLSFYNWTEKTVTVAVLVPNAARVTLPKSFVMLPNERVTDSLHISAGPAQWITFKYNGIEYSECVALPSSSI